MIVVAFLILIAIVMMMTFSVRFSKKENKRMAKHRKMKQAKAKAFDK